MSDGMEYFIWIKIFPVMNKKFVSIIFLTFLYFKVSFLKDMILNEW